MTDVRRLLEAQLSTALAGQGLEPRGWFTVEAGDIPAGAGEILPGNSALLIGNHGRAMWDAFAQSPEHGDGSPDPMDRWTRRVILEAMDTLPLGGKALFPFGAQLWPFQRFAARAMGLKASPLGLLIHPRYGLWHALRAAILFPELGPSAARVHTLIHPCDECLEKPCLSTCPVSAFDGTGFAVKACRGYLDMTVSSQNDSSLPDCMDDGCAARNACPVGREWRYGEAQLRFHMASFRGAGDSDRARLVGDLKAIASENASRPVLDARSPEDNIGYDDWGLPSGIAPFQE
jgi:hypothetical protein